MKRNLTVIALALLCVSAFAQNKLSVRMYGFVRNYMTYDSRAGKAGTAELYYYVPLDRSLNAAGDDMNAYSTMKWAALTSRIGLDAAWRGDEVDMKAKIETDFYSGLSGVTGTAAMRLRQAYFDVKYKELTLRAGQAWHPMAADMPDCIALEIAVPFGPFSRTPQVQAIWNVTEHLSVTGAMLWQMQYTSAGPEGASANYLKYSGIPEGYIGLNFKSGAFLARAGVDCLSIKPRYKGEVLNSDGTSYTAFVSDRLTDILGFVYLQYKGNRFSAKVKSTFGEGGEHLNLHGGYGVTAKYTASGEDGHYEYTPTLTSSTWASLAYKCGNGFNAALLLGYIKSLGTEDDLMEVAEGSGLAEAGSHYLAKNTYANISSIARVAPMVSWTYGPLTLALEYTVTAAQYGDYLSYTPSATGAKALQCVGLDGLTSQNSHWVANHRLQFMTKFTF